MGLLLPKLDFYQIYEIKNRNILELIKYGIELVFIENLN